MRRRVYLTVLIALGLQAGGCAGQDALVPLPSRNTAAAPHPRPGAEGLAIERPQAAAPEAAPPVADVAVEAPFDARGDEVLLGPLRTAALANVRVNYGGTSISLRLDFVGGGRASFKPEQTNPQSVPRREVAAYRLDRLLGIQAVAPAIGRSFPVDELYAALDRPGRAVRQRLKDELISRKDPADPHRRIVVGEVQWWIPAIEFARIGRHRIDETRGIVAWKRLLRAGATIPDERYQLVRQISTMLLFDFVIDNVDRWSGANARISPDGSKLYFMDNTMAFSRDADGHRKSKIYLERCQTFSRRLVERLRDLGEDEVRAVLAHDLGPFDRLLTDEELVALFGRRDAALAYIDGLIAEHGDAAVLVFP